MGEFNKIMKIREHMVFTGRVQGVGFRYKVSCLARNCGVTGFAHNEYDGSVTVELQGTQELIDRIVQRLQQDDYIRIDRILREQMELKEDQGFSVRG